MCIDGGVPHSQRAAYPGSWFTETPADQAAEFYWAHCPTRVFLSAETRCRQARRARGRFFAGPEASRGNGRGSVRSVSATVAINLIVQHIQDILSGDICKWHRGSNGRSYKRTFPEPGDHPAVLTSGKRSHLESSSRPH